jgi:hypothetical protein
MNEKPQSSYAQVVTSKRIVSPAAHDEPMKRLWANIKQYDLAAHIAEIDTFGLTIVPPEKAAPHGFADRLREGLLRVIETMEGRRPDFDTGESHRNQILGGYHYLILKDPVFQEMLCQPVALTLLDYLLGEGAIVHANSALCKGPHDEAPGGGELILGLHSDNQLLPGPFHSFAEFCNITWALTDYTKAGGALAYVPGSHLLCRHPLPGEGVEQAVPVECPAGSLICWHGNTWHGAFRRTIPGIRLSIADIFSRPYIWPRHPLRDDVTPDILERNPPRFAKLCGKHVMTNWRDEGPSYEPGFQHGYLHRFH